MNIYQSNSTKIFYRNEYENFEIHMNILGAQNKILTKLNNLHDLILNSFIYKVIGVNTGNTSTEHHNCNA